jgi:hypothetical protein
MDAELQFYQLSVTFRDLGVHQTIVYIPESEAGQSAPVVKPIEWDKVVPAKHSLYASKDLDDMRDFIVPNGLDDLATPVSKAHSQTPRLLTALDPNILSREIDHTLLYMALTSGTSDEADSTEINVVIDHWKQVLADSVHPPSGTL